MKFEFDPEKSRLNERRHGVDFEWAQRLWTVTHVVIPAKDAVGEQRFFILAMVADKCLTAVFTIRGKVVRLISCHRADSRLERIYAQKIQH